MKWYTNIKLSLCVVSVMGGVVSAHSDVRPSVVGGKIMTGGIDDATSEITASMRSFGFDYGENAANPFVISDPGFNAAAGSGLPGGAQVKFNILSSLQYWDGAGAVHFTAPPSTEAIVLNKVTGPLTSNNVTITGASGFQNGYSIQTVNSDGSIHQHLNNFLLGSDGNADAASIDGVEAPAGVYAFKAELFLNPSSGIIKSDPIYFVFNNGLTEEQHDDAIAYAASIVPEPTSLCLLSIGAIGMLRRRRRI